jgi:hypothetical protein
MKEMKQKLTLIKADIEWIENALRLIDTTRSMLNNLRESKNFKYIQSIEHLKSLLRKYGQYRGIELDSVFEKVGESKSHLLTPQLLLKIMKDVLEQEKSQVFQSS